MDTESVEIFNRLEEAVKTAPDETTRVDALNRLASAIRFNDIKRVVSLAEQAERIAAGIPYPCGVAMSLRWQGWGFLHLAELGTARERLLRGGEISRRIAETGVEADCLLCLGATYYSLAEYPAALDCYLQAVRLRQELGDRAGEADARDGVGAVYDSVDDHENAFTYHFDALKLREALPDKPGLAISLNNVGGMYAKRGDFGTALTYTQQCLEICRRTRTKDLQIFCLCNLAEYHGELGRHEDAVSACREALCLACEIGNRIYECSSLLALGREYTRVRQASHASSLYREALALARRQSNRSHECETLLALGQCSLEANDLAAARVELSEAADLAEELGLKQPAYQAFEGLSAVCEREGDFAGALAFHKRFQALEKEVFNDAAERRGKMLMVQMEVEKAQKETELHRLKNVELAEANRRLQEQAELLQAQAEELRAQADELERQATTDGLTGLHNRRYLEGALARQFAHAHQSGRPLTVVMADIDHFKQINDLFGHQVGDEVLMTVALLLRDACVPSALVARYGGEEFALTLSDAGLEDGWDVCERVRRAVQNYAWAVIHPALKVTVSLGLSADTSVPNHERLLGLADEQLYEAKRAGRNCVRGRKENGCVPTW